MTDFLPSRLYQRVLWEETLDNQKNIPRYHVTNASGISEKTSPTRLQISNLTKAYPALNIAHQSRNPTTMSPKLSIRTYSQLLPL